MGRRNASRLGHGSLCTRSRRRLWAAAATRQPRHVFASRGIRGPLRLTPAHIRADPGGWALDRQHRWSGPRRCRDFCFGSGHKAHLGVSVQQPERSSAGCQGKHLIAEGPRTRTALCAPRLGQISVGERVRIGPAVLRDQAGSLAAAPARPMHYSLGRLSAPASTPAKLLRPVRQAPPAPTEPYPAVAYGCETELIR